MPIYSFVCSKCGNKFESIEKVGTKFTICKCDYIAKRDGDIEGKTLIQFKEPGGVHNPGFSERKYE